MPEWRNDSELCSLVKTTLYTPVVGDILDQCGRFHQFLPQAVRPLREEMKLVGRAMPVLQADAFGSQEKPFGLMTQALDDLRAGEVYLATGVRWTSSSSDSRSKSAPTQHLDSYSLLAFCCALRAAPAFISSITSALGMASDATTPTPSCFSDSDSASRTEPGLSFCNRISASNPCPTEAI